MAVRNFFWSVEIFLGQLHISNPIVWLIYIKASEYFRILHQIKQIFWEFVEKTLIKYKC